MRFRTLVLPLLASAFLLAWASAALADPPPTTPCNAVHVTFETTATTDTLQTDRLAAWGSTGPNWGRIADRHLGGSFGFWCAGNGGAFPYYTAGTHGMAYVAVPDMTQWISPTVQFSFYEPSVMSGDAGSADPFVVSWCDGSKAATASPDPADYSRATWGARTTAWRTMTIQRGDYVDGGMISKTAGWLRFQFISDPLSTGNAEGATVDDINVYGYEFGQPRNVTAARQHGALTTVTVSWDAPYLPGTTSPDARPIRYRVWRHDAIANTWTELTSTGARVAGHQITDTNVPTDGKFEYVVQGWEATGGNYGQVSPVTLQSTAGPAYTHFGGATASPDAVAYNGISVIKDTLLDEVGTPIGGAASKIVVQRSIHGGAWTTIAGAAGESDPGVYSVSVASLVNADYRLYYTQESRAGAPVHVSAGAYVGTPSISASSVKHGKKFTVKGKVSGIPGVGRTVTLRAYRLQSGKWVLKTTTTVKVGPSSGTLSFKKSWSLKTNGTYHVTATVSDAYSRSTTSNASKSFKVK